MTLYCGECKQECDITSNDESFDHEFGTEYVTSYSSSCCNSGVFKEKCPECCGTGVSPFLGGSECIECEGVGLLYELDGLQLKELHDEETNEYRRQKENY